MHTVKTTPRVSEAIYLIRQAEANAKLAQSLYDELTGADREYDGITARKEGKYVTVCDGQDRWFAKWDDYEYALVKVIEKAIAGKYRVEESRGYARLEDQAEAYNDLRLDCPAIYSRIGFGQMTAEQFAAWLASDEYEYDDAESMADYFGVDLPTQKEEEEEDSEDE